jgi:hypothetical protein
LYNTNFTASVLSQNTNTYQKEKDVNDEEDNESSFVFNNLDRQKNSVIKND